MDATLLPCLAYLNHSYCFYACLLYPLYHNEIDSVLFI